MAAFHQRRMTSTVPRRAPPFPSALMRSPHHLDGILDMAPLLGFVSIALFLAGQRVPGRMGDRLHAVPLEHLPRNGVNLRFGHHVALLVFHPSSMLPRRSGSNWRIRVRSNGGTGGPVPPRRGTSFCVSRASRSL